MKKILKSSLSLLLAVTIIFSSAYVGLSEIDFGGLFVVEANAASMGDDCYKIILTWGASPRDLDSHVSGTLADGTAFHCYFGEKNIYYDDSLVVNLDKDDTSSYGPETTTITLDTSVFDGDFTYYVYNYSGTGSIPGAGATVSLYKGDTLLGEYDASGSSSGRYWTLFHMKEGNIYLIDEIGSSVSNNISESAIVIDNVWSTITQVKSDYSVLSYSDLKAIDDANVTYDNSNLNITATDYYSVNISDCTLISSAVMVFGAIPTSTDSHISAVHCNGYDAIVEAENVKFPISGQVDDDEKVININVYTDLADFTEFQLLQNGAVLQTSSTGSFSFNAKSIPVGSSLDVRVVGSDGTKYRKIETNIKTHEAKSDFSVQGSKISITLPEDVFIIGGAQFELDLEDLPVFIMRSDDSIKIGIGASETSKYVKNGETENSELWGDWKHLVDNLKNDYIDGMIDYKAYSCMHDLNMGKFFSSTGFVPKGSAKICAYAEFRFVDGEWTAVGGNGCLAVSISVSNEWQTFVWAVPVVIKLEGSVGANADFSVGFDFDEGRWYADCDVDFTLPEVRGSVGVGIARVFDGSAYLKLKNNIKISYKNEYISCVLNGELGLSGKFLCFSGEKTLWNFLDWQYYYNSWADSGTASSLEYSEDFLSSGSLYDKNSYSIDTREHLETQSEWYGAYNISAFSIDEPVKYTEKLLQESVYEAVNPKTVTTSNGTTMMVWTADIAERTTGNHTALVYSVYDNELGIWSEPQIVYDDGTADSYPDVVACGNNIYITWVNVNQQFDETVTVEQMAEACEISLACYNSETLSFDKIADLTGDSYFNYLPAITVVDDNIYVGYAENTGNNPFTQEGENSLYIATVNADGSYTTEKVITTVNSFTGLDIGFLENNLNLAFLMDTDSDITTSEDVELYIYDNNKQIIQITDNSVVEQSVQFASINGIDSFSYYCSNNIYYFNDVSNINSVTVSGNSVFSPEYKFIDDENGTVLISKAISTKDDAANIYSSVYSGENWLNPVKITDSEIDIKSFDVYNTANKGVGVVYSKSQIEVGELTEEGTGKYKGTYTEVVDLYSTSFERYFDISLNSVSVNEEELNSEGNISVAVNVTNNGLTTLDSFTLDVQSNAASVYQTTLENLALLPGETREINVDISVGLIEALTTYKFIVSIGEIIDVESTNNEKEVPIGYVDLDLSLERNISDGNTSCVAVIKNNSCISSDLEMVLRKNSYDGDIVRRQKLSSIGAYEEIKYYITPDFISDNFVSGDAVCIEIISAKDEKILGNNYQFFAVSKPEVDIFEYTILDNNCIQITKYNGGNSAVVIPRVFDDYTVTSIASNIISSDITSITLPSTIGNIDVAAFNSATSLKEIIIDDENATYTDINGVLYSADKTTVIRCPIAYEDDFVFESETSTISDYAFSDCTNLVLSAIPDGITNIGNYAFNECVNLTSISIPDSVTSIGDHAFRYCSNITEVDLPDSAFSIGKYAFADTGITELTLPENLISLGNSAFNNCENLQKINYNAVNCAINVSNLFTAMLNHPFRNSSNITEINVGESVEAIPSYMFYGKGSITTVYITNLEKWCGIDFQGAYANPINFAEEVYLNGELITEQLVIPETVGAISNYAFHNFTGITSVIIPDSVVSIGANAFDDCSDLKYVFYTGTEEEWSAVTIGENNSYLTDSYIHYETTEHIYSDEWTVDVAPTCLAVGSTSHNCIYCDCKIDVTEIPATGHSYSTEWTIDVEATCAEVGSKSHHCVNCGDKADVTLISATGHNFSTEWTIDVAPTCTENGSKSHHCIVCDDKADVTVIEALGHDYSTEWTVDVEATCTEDGSKSHHCTVCDDKGDVTIIEALGHDYSTEWTIDAEATCIEDGSKSHHCTVCDDKGDVTIIEALGHNYSTEWTIDVEATCTEDGSKSHHCTVCDDMTDVTVIEAPGHIYEDVIVQAATCTGAGLKYQKCTGCGNELSDEIIDPTGHTFSTEWIVELLPTCTTTGLKAHRCIDCGDKTDVTVIEAIGHNYGDWEVFSEPTCVAAGINRKVCFNCGGAETERVPAKGHRYSSEWTIDIAPTCTEEGSKSHHCTICNSKTDITVIETTSHVFTLQNVEDVHPHTTTYKCSFCDETKTETPSFSECIECNYTFTLTDSGSYKLVSYIGTETEVIVPAIYNGIAVAEISNNCFKGNTTITSVEITEGVTTMGSAVFYGCTSLTSVTIPGSLTNIGNATFYNCTSLTSVIISDGITSIGNAAFRNCTGLTAVTIPESVTTIGSAAFYGFTGTIYCVSGSAAHEYAVANSIDYVLINIFEVSDTQIDYDNFIIYTSIEKCSDITELLSVAESSSIVTTASYKTESLELYGTGTIITVFDGNDYIGDFTLIVEGDTNGDSVCDILDVTDVERASNGNAELSGAYAIAADSNSDDVIDITDYQTIVNKALAL